MTGILLLMLATQAPAGEPPAGWTTVSQPSMSTRIDVTLPADEAHHAPRVFEEFHAVERTANEWRAEAPLAAVNRAAGGGPVPIPEDLAALLSRALEIAALTDGAYDPTWAALWGLWDFRSDDPRVPEPAHCATLASLVDHRALELDVLAGTARLPVAGMALGLGGIAKGHALARGADALRQVGVTDFAISAGGQVYAAGQRDGRPWRVGIRDPRGPDGTWFAMVEVSDASVSTSGDYERFFVVDGVRYHHLLDPKTGRPARGVRSATVLSSDALLADALSTALVVMGVDRGMALVEDLPDVETVLVDDQARVHRSTGIVLHDSHPPQP